MIYLSVYIMYIYTYIRGLFRRPTEWRQRMGDDDVAMFNGSHRNEWTMRAVGGDRSQPLRSVGSRESQSHYGLVGRCLSDHCAERVAYALI